MAEYLSMTTWLAYVKILGKSVSPLSLDHYLLLGRGGDRQTAHGQTRELTGPAILAYFGQ